MTTTEQYQEACLADARVVYIYTCHDVVAEVEGPRFRNTVDAPSGQPEVQRSWKLLHVTLRLELAILGDREN